MIWTSGFSTFKAFKLTRPYFSHYLFLFSGFPLRVLEHRVNVHIDAAGWKHHLYTSVFCPPQWIMNEDIRVSGCVWSRTTEPLVLASPSVVGCLVLWCFTQTLLMLSTWSRVCGGWCFVQRSFCPLSFSVSCESVTGCFVVLFTQSCIVPGPSLC